VFLDAVEVEGRKVFAVGHCLESIAVAAHSDEFLDVGVPWRDVVVTYRPVNPVPLSLGRREFVFAPALAGAPPDDRFAADLVAADPVERLLLHVRVITILHEEVGGVFAITRGLADERIFLELLTRHCAAMRELPRVEIHGGVVLDVDYVAPALENERLQSLFAELLGCPPTGNSRANDDRIEGGCVRGHGVPCVGVGEAGARIGARRVAGKNIRG